MRTLRNASHLVLALALVAMAGCQSDSPTEPSSRPSTPQPPPPVVTYNIVVTADPSQLTVGSTTPSTVTVEVRRADNGQAPPDLTQVTLTTTLGEFGSVGSGTQTVNLQLINGRAQAALFPGTAVGTATLRAQVDQNVGGANVDIRGQETFFVSSISPSVGAPEGGQVVNIDGGGFDDPVRVTFNGATAQVISVTPTRIRVRTPSATAAGINVPVGTSVPVNVVVTVNLNETGQLTDTLANGFVYSAGSTVEPPRVFSMSPTSGTNDGGTRVTIIGSGFQNPVQVLFGLGTSASSFNGVEATVESVDANRIVVITPSARGFGQNLLNRVVDVLVKNLNSGFNTISPQAFKYGTNVLITGMGPGSGPYTGGTQVTITGQGFDDPVAVSLGGVGQQVLSVSGTQVVFRTVGVVVNQCPSNGQIAATGVSVTNLDTGDSATASNLTFLYLVPRPQIFGISPTGGSPGNTATITGQNFATNVQVLFGDPTNGSSAPINSNNASSINVRVPQAPAGFTFNTEPCDGNGDGIPGGTRNSPTAISVTVRNLDGTGCFVTLPNAYLLNPPNTTCTGDTSEPPPTTPQCNDGIDNDGDGRIDFGAGPTNDPQCTSLEDNSESI